MIWSLNETQSRENIQEIQLKRLKKTVQTVYDKVPYYRELFREKGVRPKDIQTLDDLSLLPFTTKDDLRNNYPFGLFAVPSSDIVRYHASSGTTGNPTVVGYTKRDMKTWKECIARIVTMAGVSKRDTAHIAFGYGLFTGAFGLHQGLEKVGAGVVPMSSGNTRKQIKLMKDFGATVLIATPSYALRLADVAMEMGIDPKEDLKLRVGCFGGEGSSAALRAKIADTYGLFATENYGMSELIGPGVSGECSQLAGMHINEDFFIPEIIDPVTGRVLPEGEVGELVITPIRKQALPLIRYRTKDITSLTYETCACGRTTARMAMVSGRTDDMLIISGVNVFPSQIEEVLFNVKGVGSNYQITVTNDNFIDHISVDVEVIDNEVLESVTALENLYAELKLQMHTILGIRPKINLVENKSLKQSEGKAKRVVDLRKGEL